MTGNMVRTPGRKVTRRIEEPRIVGSLERQPGVTAQAFADAHNQAVRQYGSNSGGRHAFHVPTRESAGVWDGTTSYPADTVVTSLSWGHLSTDLAQRLLTGDGWGDEP